jgi:hypothetical protein
LPFGLRFGLRLRFRFGAGLGLGSVILRGALGTAPTRAVVQTGVTATRDHECAERYATER